MSDAEEFAYRIIPVGGIGPHFGLTALSAVTALRPPPNQAFGGHSAKIWLLSEELQASPLASNLRRIEWQAGQTSDPSKIQ